MVTRAYASAKVQRSNLIYVLIGSKGSVIFGGVIDMIQTNRGFSFNKEDEHN